MQKKSPSAVMRSNCLRQWVVIFIVSWVVVCTGPSLATAEDTESLKRELQLMKAQMELLQKRVDQLTALSSNKQAPELTGEALSSATQAMSEKVAAQVIEKIQPSLQANSKSFASEFNPAIGLFIDTVASVNHEDHGNFEFRAAELALSANIDPFSKAYGILNGTDEGIEVEEAAIQTTALAYNLSLRGGRFFADFGRLSKFHDHDLPFVNRPLVLDSFVGGESGSDGLELNYLVPIEHYLSFTLGAYNKIGSENERVANSDARGMKEFTYLGRASTFIDFSDASNIEIGVSLAHTPSIEVDENHARTLSGLDFTYRYSPLDSGRYQGVVWGTEILKNIEERPVGGFPESGEQDAVPLVFKKQNAYGLYSYLETKLTRAWTPGLLYDYTQEIDDSSKVTQRFSPYLTFRLSEFQRFRFQYSYLDKPDAHDQQLFLQWTAVLGDHSHGFRDR